MNIGTFLEPENLNTEYKEFRYNIKDYLGKMKIHDTKHYNWKKILPTTKKVIYKYFDIYFPKYLTSFANTNIENGELYFGVSDSGEVLGIPFDNKIITKDKIIKKIHKKIRSTISKFLNETLITKSEIEKIVDTFIKNTNIEIIELSLDENLFDDNLDELINEYSNEYETYLTHESEYVSEKKSWIDKICYYKKSINTMINQSDIRKELIEFIKDDELVDIMIREKLIGILETQKVIEFIDGQIMDEKNDHDKLAYWITKFRDHKVTEFVKIRPKYHNLIKPDLPYLRIVREFRPIIKQMMNCGIPMVLIKIKLLGRDAINNILPDLPKIGYKISDRFKISVRVLDHNVMPCCIEFNL